MALSAALPAMLAQSTWPDLPHLISSSASSRSLRLYLIIATGPSNAGFLDEGSAPQQIASGDGNSPHGRRQPSDAVQCCHGNSLPPNFYCWRRLSPPPRHTPTISISCLAASKTPEPASPTINSRNAFFLKGPAPFWWLGVVFPRPPLAQWVRSQSLRGGHRERGAHRIGSLRRLAAAPFEETSHE
jgi:hypothetical protein